MSQLDRDDRARLIRRASHAHVDAVRLGYHAALTADDLALLLDAYRREHRRLASAADSSSARDARSRLAMVTALRARWHADRCGPCRDLMNRARQNSALARREAAALAEQNRRLRETVTTMRAWLHRLTVAHDALICERDEARWKLRNAQLVERHEGALVAAGSRS